MYRAFKFRLYPNNEQKILINKTFGCSRFVYNYYLNKIKDSKYINAYTNISDYVNNLKCVYPFLQEADSIIIRKSIFHLDDNIKKCYNNHFDYQKYKNKYFYQVDEYYPSSQKCNHCGNIDKRYKDIKERTYKCTKCSNVIGRDLNASLNICHEGLKLYHRL